MQERLNRGSDAVALEIDESLPNYRGDRVAAVRWEEDGVTIIELAAPTPESKPYMTFKESLPFVRTSPTA